MEISPQRLGLPHTEFRPGQLEMIKRVALSGKKYILVYAPTGSGKTSLPAGLSKYHEGPDRRVVAVVGTNELQTTNYASLGFDYLLGRKHYACEHTEKAGLSAEHCIFPNHMPRCPQAMACGYLQAKNQMLASNRASLNYAYYQVQGYAQQPPPYYLVLDEAHDLSDYTIEWAGISFGRSTLDFYSLPMPPFISGPKTGSLLSNSGSAADRALIYLQKCSEIMKNFISHIERNLGKAKDSSIYARSELFKSKIDATIAALGIDHSEWFIKSGPNALPDNENNYGFFAKPLTARHHFTNLFANAAHVVLMSATMSGETFAKELGLTDYDFIEVPNPWAPAARPLWDLGAPSIGQKSTEADLIEQARLIARALDDCPSTWSGIIHTTSKSRAFDLHNRIARTCRRPLFVPDTKLGTAKQAEQWVEYRNSHPGAIVISWNMFQGYDGTAEQINIITKTPFPDTSAPFERQRQYTNGSFYYQRAAWKLQQMAGRVRRGRDEDYDTPTEKRAFVAVADSNYKRTRNYMAKDFLEAIIPYG